MPKASTIKYAKENLTSAEFAAWESMPVKLSKKQMKAGERPPGFAPAEPVEAKPKAVCAEGGCEATVPGGVKGMAHCKAHASQPEDEDTEGFVDALLVAAGNHAEKSDDDDHEVGDLIVVINVFWKCMSKKARLAATNNDDLQQLLADWLEEGEDEDN
jgi:hypothetical protein